MSINQDTFVLQDLCQNGGSCNTTTGTCQCDKTTIWQNDDLCEENICNNLNCVQENTMQDNNNNNNSCEMISTITNTTTNEVSYTLQCKCIDSQRFTGQRCEVQTQCSVQQAMLQCNQPSGVPMLNETTNQYKCSYQGSFSTPQGSGRLCQQCNLRCLNNGKDYSQCLGQTCTCPNNGNTLFYGPSCECKGVILTSTLPITSEKISFIYDKRQEVENLFQLSQQNDDKVKSSE